MQQPSLYRLVKYPERILVFGLSNPGCVRFSPAATLTIESGLLSTYRILQDLAQHMASINPIQHCVSIIQMRSKWNFTEQRSEN